MLGVLGDVPPRAVATVAGSLLALVALGWALLARAATRLAAARAEFAALRAELDERRAKLVEFANLEGRFVGNIAHEMQTPLATVLVQVDLLRRCSLDSAAVQAHAKGIDADIRHLSELVDSFLHLARPFAHAETSGHVPVDVHDLVVEAARRSQSMARDQGIKVVLRLAESSNGDGPLEVLGDAVLLEAMFEHLLRNAVRLASRGSRVHVEVLVRSEAILLRVRNVSAGTAVEDIASVFEWFMRAPGLTAPSSGAGFDLAIARRVAEDHGGSITLRDPPGGGCQFELTLPRWRGDEDLPPASRMVPTGAPLACSG
ncbi:MAG TPA: HAMP domain-containing sensor histidine kinase [Planctomycetota bacterium]|nr:HAMP domain-containing sensor histidine kinase [Planctomycetota bacterium]